MVKTVTDHKFQVPFLDLLIKDYFGAETGLGFVSDL